MLRIQNKLLVSFILLNLLCTGLAMTAIYSEMRPHFLEAVEYTLIDMSRFLASEVSARSEKDPQNHLRIESLREAVQKLEQTPFPGRRNIYDRANRSSLRIFVTDAQGRVVFDSHNGENEGQDFSQWRDVKLTLEGEYGARATRLNPGNPNTSTHFVAAPIMSGDKIVGVVSVGKPVQSVSGFLNYSRLKMILIFGASLLAALIVSLIASYWISRPVHQLEKYVKSLGSPTPGPFPVLPADEIGALGAAFESIRQELEGKKYVEKYVHNLTHEIKAPLTAIIGAAELVNGPDVSGEDRRQLLHNIRSEANRLQDIAEKLLELASLEARERVGKIEDFDLRLVLEEILDSVEVPVRKHNLRLVLQAPENFTVRGERFLIWRAVSNLIQNAIDFAPDGTAIEIEAVQNANQTSISVNDVGPGIPDYALGRVTEKFFSLERPRTGKKSSGLGLSFVNEVMNIHNGTLTFLNKDGTRAQMIWPS